MKKNSILLRVGVAAMVLTLATTSLMSGTLAKYTTAGTGVAEAIVAKFDPQLFVGKEDPAHNVTGKTGTQSFTFKLSETQLDGKVNSNVASERIAPGMSGSIPIIIDPNGMETDYSYIMHISFKLPDGNSDSNLVPTNLTFKVGGNPGAGSSVVAGPANNPSVLDQATGPLKSSDGKVTKYLSWEWPYETTPSNGTVSDGDADDMAAGAAAAAEKVTSVDLATVQFVIDITVTQYDGTLAA